MKKKYYGWYSADAAKKFGTATYDTPDRNIVYVTNVTLNETHDPGLYNWDDVISVGEVITCISGFPMPKVRKVLSNESSISM